MADARDYVTLAERANGPIPQPTDFAWPWGEALALIDEFAPDVRLINLETTITTDGEFAPGKAVHYRMNPANIACLGAVRPDACALANNHILDFGPRGLADTLRALADAGIRGVGAGLTAEQAQRTVLVPLADEARAVIASYAMESSGVPRRWAASQDRPGVAFLPDLSDRSADEVADRVLAGKQPRDITIVSVHWGSNWGYEVEPRQVRFAHRLIDAGVDVVHGHSSHHLRPVEIYRGRLILYGCGDIVDDYEGIGAHRAFRPELRLLYFASMERNDDTATTLALMPVRIKRMRLERASHDAIDWLRSTLERISEPFGTLVNVNADGSLGVYPS